MYISVRHETVECAGVLKFKQKHKVLEKGTLICAYSYTCSRSLERVHVLILHYIHCHETWNRTNPKKVSTNPQHLISYIYNLVLPKLVLINTNF